MRPATSQRGGGLPLAIGAYLIWGLMPVYLRELHAVPVVEFVGWRVVFTLPVCIAIVVLRRQTGEILGALRNPRALGAMTASALLIGGNWLVYAFAVQTGHLFAVSLGYYINPLVNVLAGTIFLGERLSRRQWAAVAIAGGAVALLAWGARDMLTIALSLALSFAAYGLVRKLAPVGSLGGLTLESVLLVLPAAGIVLHFAASPQGTSFGISPWIDAMLGISGALTASALLMFAEAARRMDYSALGFVQYLSPTLAFLLGLLVWHEPLRPIQLVSFVLIWSAIALFSWDLLARRRATA